MLLIDAQRKVHGVVRIPVYQSVVSRCSEAKGAASARSLRAHTLAEPVSGDICEAQSHGDGASAHTANHVAPKCQDEANSARAQRTFSLVQRSLGGNVSSSSRTQLSMSDMLSVCVYGWSSSRLLVAALARSAKLRNMLSSSAALIVEDRSSTSSGDLVSSGLGGCPLLRELLDLEAWQR